MSYLMFVGCDFIPVNMVGVAFVTTVCVVVHSNTAVQSVKVHSSLPTTTTVRITGS